MAVRHEVENLIRRGNIFHWRARVPARFKASYSKDRLTFSLQISDHGVAKLVARHLNLQLAELKNQPPAYSMSHDALQNFLISERDKALEKLGNVALVSRRYGNANSDRDAIIDLEHGWAYRLLENFGQNATFDFGNHCRARSWLLSQGVSDKHIAQIAENFETLKDMLPRGILEKQLQGAMAKFGVTNNALNRERAMIAYFQAQGDALMAVQERYPLAVSSLASSGQNEANAAPQPTSMPEAKPAPSIPAEYGGSVQSLCGDRAVANESTLAEMQVEAHPPIHTRNKQITLPVDEFIDAGELMIKKKGDEWTKETANDARALIRMFVGILNEFDVKHSGEIIQFHIGKLTDHFTAVPTHWGRSSAMRKLSTIELRERAIEIRTKNPDAKIGLEAATVRKHLANLNNFLTYLRGNGYEVLDWTFDGIRPKKPKPGSVRLQQFKPRPKDIEPIFSAPVFTGCKSAKARDEVGDEVFHGALYYLPIMFTYIGARRLELAGLHVNDIYQDEENGNEWTIHIRPNELRRVKTIQSDRKIPLHPELIRLGILDYQKRIRKLGYSALFPELFSRKTDNDPGDRFYNEFVPLMEKSLGGALWSRTLHAFRHGLADYLKQNGVPPATIDDLCGRLNQGETNTRYTSPAGIPLLKNVLAKFPIITSGIVPREIQILPWVEEGNPDPWSRKSPKKN